MMLALVAGAGGLPQVECPSPGTLLGMGVSVGILQQFFQLVGFTLWNIPLAQGSLPFDILFFAGGCLAKQNKWLEKFQEERNCQKLQEAMASKDKAAISQQQEVEDLQGHASVLQAQIEAMQEETIEPDMNAHFDAIRCYIKVERLETAVLLYKELAEEGMPSCSPTCGHLSNACRKRGWTEMANKISADITQG